jgi:hypothetical protein
MSKVTFGPPYRMEDGWSKIYQTNPLPPGFWTANRIDLTTGELVLQLGVNPHARISTTNSAFVFAGFHRTWEVPADGTYHFSGIFEPHRITVRNNGAAVYTQAILAAVNFDQRDVTSFTPVDLNFYVGLKKSQKIVVAYAAIIQMSYTADQTATAEILARAGTLVTDSLGATVAPSASRPLDPHLGELFGRAVQSGQALPAPSNLRAEL